MHHDKLIESVVCAKDERKGMCLNVLTENMVIRNEVHELRHFNDSSGPDNEWQLCGVLKQ